jgi:hypothetical protein
LTAVFSPQPVVFLPLNQIAQEKDQSGNGNDAVIHDLTLTRGPSGQSNNAYWLQGSSASFISIKASKKLDIGKDGSLTIAGFIKPVATALVPIIEFAKPGGRAFHVWIVSGKLYAQLLSTAGSPLSVTFTNLPLAQNKWNFVAFSYDKTAKRAIGIRDSESQIFEALASQNIDTATTEVIIGKETTIYYKGGISCLMMFDQALGVEDMKRARSYCLDMLWPFHPGECHTLAQNAISWPKTELLLPADGSTPKAGSHSPTHA